MRDALQDYRSLLLGLLAALVSTAIVMGSFAVALTEGGVRVALLLSPTYTLTAADTSTPPPPPATLAPGAPTPTTTYTQLPSPTQTSSPLPTPVACQPPAGWISIEVQPGDTLNHLAQASGTTDEELARANCLIVSRLVPGSILYIPPPPSPTLAPTITPRPVPCAPPPSNWVIYIVQRGDTLFNLGRIYGVSVADLKKFNCLAFDLIYVGQRLYVPFVPTPLPSPTSTPTTTATQAPTSVPSPTATSAQTQVPTPPPSPTPTFTASPTLTFTPSPTATLTSTPTMTPTLTPTLSPSPSPKSSGAS